VRARISMGGSESQPATVSEEKDTACDEEKDTACGEENEEATLNSCKGMQHFTALENGIFNIG